MNKKKIIVFPPESCLWQHSFPTAIFADNLQKINFNVEYFLPKASPAGHLANGNNKNQGPIFDVKYCEQCKKKKKLILKSFGFKCHYLEEYLSDTDLHNINKIIESAKNKKSEYIYNLKYKGIDVGKFASYVSVLINKKIKIEEFDEIQKKKYLAEFKECLLVTCAFYKFFSEHKVSSVVVYNSYYGKNRCIKFLAKKFNIPTIAIHGGNNRSIIYTSLLSTKMDLLDYTISIQSKFSKFSSNLKSIKLLLEHLAALFDSKSYLAWSTPVEKNFNTRDHFKIKENQKIILLALSSPDEKIASRAAGTQGAEVSKKDFRSQESLIKFIEKYASKRDDVFLIIRVHPREFVNKRDKVTSVNYFKLKKISLEIEKKKYKNIKFNFPEEEISFYDIVTQIDLLVSEGSTVNIETSILGLPCVLPRGIYPDVPSSLVNVARNKKHLSQLIDKYLKKEIDPKIIINTFRYFSYLQDYTTFKFPFLTAPNTCTFFERAVRYIINRYFYGSHLDILFYKLKNFRNKVTIKFQKNFDIKSLSYFEFHPRNQIDVRAEKKLVLDNLKFFLLKKTDCLKNPNSKLSRFFNKI
jgi:hypothetical protein